MKVSSKITVEIDLLILIQKHTSQNNTLEKLKDHTVMDIQLPHICNYLLFTDAAFTPLKNKA